MVSFYYLYVIDLTCLFIGQLTQKGSEQVESVGCKFWKRYRNFILRESNLSHVDTLYCRSTNICRTLLSMRSFLHGFFNHEPSIISLFAAKLPVIIARPKLYETMYPGPCDTLQRRRLSLIENNYNNATIPSYYDDLQSRLKLALRFPITESFSWLMWLNVMEVLTCYDNHNVTLPPGLYKEDVYLTTRLVSWMWGALYKVSEILFFIHPSSLPSSLSSLFQSLSNLCLNFS
jgi:hypothetical protein